MTLFNIVRPILTVAMCSLSPSRCSLAATSRRSRHVGSSLASAVFRVYMDPAAACCTLPAACSRPRVMVAWLTVRLSAAHATYATYAIPSRLNPCVFLCINPLYPTTWAHSPSKFAPANFKGVSNLKSKLPYCPENLFEPRCPTSCIRNPHICSME